MRIELLYFDGCPHWALAQEHLAEALRRLGRGDVVHLVDIDGLDDAARAGFHGSPTILLDGRDPFWKARSPSGSTCRLYLTDAGAAGAPTVEQLMEILHE